MKEYKFKINGKPYSVSIIGMNREGADVSVNGVDYEVEFEGETHTEHFAIAPASRPESAETKPVSTASAVSRPESKGASTIFSPLPGVVIELKIREGQKVSKGQKIAVIEAMKMENELLAEKDGKVSAVFVQKGDSVLEGAKIASIE